MFSGGLGRLKLKGMTQVKESIITRDAGDRNGVARYIGPAKSTCARASTIARALPRTLKLMAAVLEKLCAQGAFEPPQGVMDQPS